MYPDATTSKGGTGGRIIPPHRAVYTALAALAQAYGERPARTGRYSLRSSALHVMLALRRSFCEVVVADEELNGSDIVGERLGKGQRLAHQTGHALAQRVQEDGVSPTQLAVELPRPYQQEAVAALLAAATRGVQRPLLVLPTGTGKTIVFALLVQQRYGRALILAHCDELIHQAVDKLQLVAPDLAIVVVSHCLSDDRGTTAVRSPPLSVQCPTCV